MARGLEPEAGEEEREGSGDVRLSLAEQQREREKCAADPVYWINAYAWTYDPREAEGCRDLKITLFPRQEEFIQWQRARLDAQEGGIGEKCRDVGFTWLTVYFQLWCWLFCPGFKGGFGSRKLDLVDDSDNPDCIFDKLRYTLRRLPKWQLPRGWDWRRHDRFRKLLNPANGSRIIGEGGDQIGRGGRTTFYVVDEAAFLERPQRAVAALSQNSNSILWISTPNGVGNPFEQMRHSGHFEVFTFRWRDDPRKNGWIATDAAGNEIEAGNGEAPTDAAERGLRLVYPWYEKQVRDWGALMVAQEIDIDYAASLDNIVIPARYVLAAVNLPIAPEPGDEMIGALDVAAGGKNETVLILRQGPLVRHVLVCQEANLVSQAHWVIEQCERFGVTRLSYDAGGIGKSIGDQFAVMERPLSFETHGILGGEAPSEMVWSNGKASKEFLRNARAEMFWLLRQRFEKAYLYRLWLEGKEGGIAHPPAEMISIPDCPKLVAQLSYPLWFRTDIGRIKVESKDEMKKRGVASPDHADALAYTEDTTADWKALARRLGLTESEIARQEGRGGESEAMTVRW